MITFMKIREKERAAAAERQRQDEEQLKKRGTCDERLISLAKKEEVRNNYELYKFLLIFAPRPLIIRYYCNDRIEPDEEELARRRLSLWEWRSLPENADILFYAEDLVQKVNNLKDEPTTKNFLDVIHYLNSYLTFISDPPPWRDRLCPLHGQPSYEGYGCKIPKNKEIIDLDEYIKVFFKLIKHILETLGRERFKTDILVNEIYMVEYVGKLFKTFFNLIGKISITIPIKLYAIYLDELNNYVGINWIIILCYNEREEYDYIKNEPGENLGGSEDSDLNVRKKRLEYTCGRATEVKWCAQNKIFKVVLFDTVSTGNDTINPIPIVTYVCGGKKTKRKLKRKYKKGNKSKRKPRKTKKSRTRKYKK